jgi:hypothetical protein
VAQTNRGEHTPAEVTHVISMLTCLLSAAAATQPGDELASVECFGHRLLFSRCLSESAGFLFLLLAPLLRDTKRLSAVAPGSKSGKRKRGRRERKNEVPFFSIRWRSVVVVVKTSRKKEESRK